MRTHGWGGNPPATDDEARRRILEAAVRCLGRDDAGLSVAQVAADLNITRQTVYRYYPDRDGLLLGASAMAASGWVERLLQHVAGLDDPAEVLVEAALFSIRLLPQEPALLQLAGPNGVGAGFVGPISLEFSAAALRRLPLGLENLDDTTIAEITEIVMRSIQSHVLHPAAPPHTDDELRSMLTRSLGPLVAAPLPAPSDPEVVQ